MYLAGNYYDSEKGSDSTVPPSKTHPVLSNSNAVIELSMVSLRVSSICNCLDRIRREVGCQWATGLAQRAAWGDFC